MPTSPKRTIESLREKGILAKQVYNSTPNGILLASQSGKKLVGYSYAGDANQDIASFFSSGDFWQDNCSNGEDTLLNLWPWNDNNTWSIYFPGDTTDNHPGLDAYNTANSTAHDFRRPTQYYHISPHHPVSFEAKK